MPSRVRYSLALLVVLIGGLGTACVSNVSGGDRKSDELSRLGRLSGTVMASQPFTAAQVYLHHMEKNITYMVFTQAGQFRALALFPGTYEVNVKAKGLESVVQTVAVGVGENPNMSIALQPGQGVEPPLQKGVTFARYQEIYPPGPGLQVIEQGCMRCHDENFLPAQPASEVVWRARLGHMMGAELDVRDARTYNEGVLAGRVQWFPFSRQDREEFIAYVVKHFGPDAKPRFVRSEQELQLDEAALGKAMFIEYNLPSDPPGVGTNSPEFARQGRSIRWGQDVRFDREGNVWLIDRGYPERLVKLEPRTGVQKSYLFPDGATNGNHEVLVDRSGIIWTPEHRGMSATNPKRILGFNPQTEQWEHKILGDPENVIRNTSKWMQSLALDSKDNLYVGWIMGGAITKWERTTGKVSVFPLSERGAVPYGVVADRNDNIWIALWSSGKLAKFDTINEQWTEYTPLTFPGHMRRPNVDAENNIWAGIWSQGRRPAKLAKLDQRTGRFTEYTVPLWASQPYDVNPDTQGNIWTADSPTPDRVALISKFNPRDETWVFYPKPQFSADTPKIQVTQDGAVWFSPRGTRDKPAVSVLHPDMDRITTLGAFYQNGPPGYPWPAMTQ